MRSVASFAFGIVVTIFALSLVDLAAPKDSWQKQWESHRPIATIFVGVDEKIEANCWSEFRGGSIKYEDVTVKTFASEKAAREFIKRVHEINR